MPTASSAGSRDPVTGPAPGAGTGAPPAAAGSPKAPAPAAAAGELTILLVRHAEPVRPAVDGPSEPFRPLTALGRLQAEELAGRLAAEAPHTIVSSPYARALQTVQPAAGLLGLEVELIDDLREWTSGLAPTPAWRDHYLHCWADPSFALPGGEPLVQAGARMVRALDGLAARFGRRGGTVVAGSHGTVISLALGSFGAPVDAELWLGMPMPAIYRVEVDRAGSWKGVRGPGLPPPGR